jgi:hypothetical protein
MVNTNSKAFYTYNICHILPGCSWYIERRKTEKEGRNGHSGCVSGRGVRTIARGSFKYLSPTEIIHMFFNSLHTKQLKWFNVVKLQELMKICTTKTFFIASSFQCCGSGSKLVGSGTNTKSDLFYLMKCTIM